MALNGKVIRNPRWLAVRCMLEVSRENLLVPEAMARLSFALSDEDRNFAHKIVYDSFRYLPGLNRTLHHFCNKGRLPEKINWLLIASICQIKFTRSPAYAIVDEANKMAAKMGFRGLKGLVNAVLRSVIREGAELWATWSERDWLLPPWLAELLSHQHGEEVLSQWLNTWTDKGIVSYWSRSGKGLAGDLPSPFVPHAFRRSSPPSVEDIQRHQLYVQNETSQAVAYTICNSGVRSVLDLCAAPGGKGLFICNFGQTERLVCCDSSPERVARLRENQKRLALDLETHCKAAENLDLEPETFELVLVDAPCSGIGIVGRHPEIKHLKHQPADETLRHIQSSILQAGWRFVAPGGYLLYTVCSLDRRELPSPPEEAILDLQRLESWLPRDLPREIQADCFCLQPSAELDGFLGMLLFKPRSP